MPYDPRELLLRHDHHSGSAVEFRRDRSFD